MTFRETVSKVVSYLDIPEKVIKPLVSGAFGFKEEDKWKLGWVATGEDKTQSLFYNGIFYFRIMLPFFVGFGIRWSGSTDKKAFLQTYAGWKLNGQFSIVFRIQSDKSAAAGYTSPNTGQAQGWNSGTK
jgi:hypothetical protein